PNAFLAELAGVLGQLLGERVRLELELATGVGRGRVDPTQLHQAVLNLALNAQDAMPQGGVLTLQTAQAEQGRRVRLTVRDTGVGMSEEVLKWAFEPFFTTKGVGQGTGLGLAAVWGIVQQVGGHVEVE